MAAADSFLSDPICAVHAFAPPCTIPITSRHSEIMSTCMRTESASEQQSRSELPATNVPFLSAAHSTAPTALPTWEPTPSPPPTVMLTLILECGDIAVAADLKILESIDQPTAEQLQRSLVQAVDKQPTLTKGSKCILHSLSSAQMNGKLCKVVGSYRRLDGRFPVYVYASKETALIKPENLRCVRTTSFKTRAVAKQSSPQPTTLLPRIIR